MLPLSLLALVSPLRARGHEAVVIDQRIDDHWAERLAGEVRHGVTFVGISSMSGCQIASGIEASDLVRCVSPCTPIVWGGVHPSLLPEQTLADPGVDIVIRGEGEEAICDLAEAMEAGRWPAPLPGVGHTEADGQPVITPAGPRPPLDGRLHPAYDAVDLAPYLRAIAHTQLPSLPIVTSRGCAYRCGYCYNCAYNERHWRGLGVGKVEELIALVTERYRAQGIYLLDDNFFGKLSHALEICEMIRRRFPRLVIYNANIRADTAARLELDQLRLLREAGIQTVFVGVESGSERVLKQIAKDITVRDVLTANEKFKAVGIVPVYSFMAGFPIETLDDVKETLWLMERVRATNPAAITPRLLLHNPFPGTALFEEYQQRGLRVPQSLREWSNLHFGASLLETMPEKQIKFLQRAVYYTNFMDGHSYVSPSRLKRLFGRLYGWIMRLRARHRFYGLMPEMRLLQRRVSRLSEVN